MRHVVITGAGSVEVREAPEPVLPAADGAVVRVEAAAICGSDLHFYDGDLPVGGDGVAVGHEFIGRITEIGPDVETLRVGDRVLAASVTGCGKCDGCATADPVQCVNGPRVFGSGVLGAGQSTAVAVEAADFQLLAIPDGIDDEAALLLTDNLCTGWIGAARADIEPGATVAVLGAGAVGLCAVRSAFVLGAERVIIADPVQGRRDLAVESGAVAAEGPTVESILAATGGRGADAVIDTVALDTTLDDALASVRAGGTVSVLGVHNLDPYPFPALAGLLRSLTVRMTTAPIQLTWLDLVPLVVSGDLRTDGIFTHSFDLDAAPQAYQLAAARSPDCVKILLRP